MLLPGERFRGLQVLLQSRECLLGKIGDGSLRFGLLLVFADMFFVISDHPLRELSIELWARQAAQLIVHFLLFRIGLGRWRHAHLLGGLLRLLQMLTVVLLQHLAKVFHVLALSFLLRQLAHIDFR